MTDEERDATRAEDHATLQFIRRFMYWICTGGVLVLIAGAVAWGQLESQVSNNTLDHQQARIERAELRATVASFAAVSAENRAHNADIGRRLERIERLLDALAQRED